MRASSAIILATLGSVSLSFANNGVSLVDLASTPPVAQSNFYVEPGQDFILTGLNPRSTALKKQSRSSLSSVTYNLNPPFKFEDFPKYEICIWAHIDGLPVIVPGANPFTGETQQYLVNLDLLDANGNFVYRSKATRLVSRGWNELKFALIHGAPQNEHVTPDFPIRRRAYHFDRIGGANQVVSQAVIRFETSESVGTIRLNSFKLKKVDTCKVVMVFDDGYKSAYETVAPMLASRNLRASLALIGKTLQYNPPAGYMSKSQARDLDDEGCRGRYIFDFLNHTYNHRPLHDPANPWTYEQVVDEIKKGQQALINLGLTRNDGWKYLVYPGGATDSQVFAACDELGIPFARGGGFNGDPNGDTHSVRNKYWGTGYDASAAENGINGYNPQQSLEQFKDWLDEGVIEGAPRHIIWHDVSRSMKTWNVPNNWNSTAWTTEMLDYIARLRNQGKVEVVTLPEWHQDLDALHRMNAVAY